MYRVRIYYHDTDAGGVVYYANYLRFFEAARTEFLRERGVDLKQWMGRGLTFVVTGAEIEYTTPARYGDLLRMETKCLSVSGARFELTNRAVRDGDGETVARGRTRLACIGKSGKPVRIPDEIRSALNASMHNPEDQG